MDEDALPGVVWSQDINLGDINLNDIPSPDMNDIAGIRWDEHIDVLI